MMFLFVPIIKKLDDWKSPAKETWEGQWAKTKERMIKDVQESMRLDQAKMALDPFLEPFSFEDLVKSARKTIWLGEEELIPICLEAWFRNLHPEDYRYGNKQLFIESIKNVLK